MRQNGLRVDRFALHPDHFAVGAPGFARLQSPFVLSWNEVFISIINLTTEPPHILNTAIISRLLQFAAGTAMALPAMVFHLLYAQVFVSMWGFTQMRRK